MTQREVLTSFRKQANWSQAQTAKALGCGLRTLKTWESSNHRADKLLELAIKALELQVPQKLIGNVRQRVPLDKRPKCHVCGSDTYEVGEARTSPRWSGRQIQDFACKRRLSRGKQVCASARLVGYFVDSVLAGQPARIPEVREWARGRVRDLGFPRELVACPIQSCPKNRKALGVHPGMNAVWKEPRVLKGYPEFGRLLKLRCWGTKRHPHNQVTRFWSYKLKEVVEVPDPYRGKKAVDWWEEKLGAMDKCGECGEKLNPVGFVKQGPLKGFRRKICLSTAPHKQSKNYYFDPSTGEMMRASMGRTDLPEQARKCLGCGARLIAAGPCPDHANEDLLVCKNPRHRKLHGPRHHHWSRTRKCFVQYSRLKRLPRKACKVERRKCPRCKKPMSWRIRKDIVQFVCPACRRRYGPSWTIYVGFDNKELHRGRTRA